MSNIRGKLRQQYIDNWLEGKEDPDVEVTPTRVDGKYIVRYRNLPAAPTPSTASAEIPSQTSTDAEVTDKNELQKDPVPEKLENHSADPVPEIENKLQNEAAKEIPTPGVMNEILEQLKIINDERHAKELKKAKKKELQQAIRKEFVRHGVMVEDDMPYIMKNLSENYLRREPPPQPIKVRRRLDLRNKLK